MISNKISLFLLVVVLITGCGGSSSVSSPATLISVSVSSANSSIPIDVTEQFTAEGTYSDGTSRDITASVTWTSGTTSVATVNASGLATGVAEGTSVITATSGVISGSKTLTVTAAVLQSIAVIPANPSIPRDVTQQFTATGTYSDGTLHDITTSVIWTSDTTSVATMNASGLATGVAAGTSVITATSGTISDSTKLTVTTATLSLLLVTPANPSIVSGLTKQFTATGTYSDGTSYDITTRVTWTSDTTSVATVNAGGLATGVAAGTAVITATGAVSGSTTLTVTAAVLQSIAVTPANPSIASGMTKQFTATGTYSNAISYDITTSVTWTSGTTSVATVDASGLATGVAAGTSVITATSGAISGSTTLTVQIINVLPITVNGLLCSSSTSTGYPNKPCVSVTVCTPGTAICQTIDDILLDTGSYGLRIFKSVLTVALTQVTSGTGSLAECALFGTGSDWGPVQTADVILGNEPAVTVPIQVIDATFGTVPNLCGTPDTSPSTAGFNGILGVGLFAEDCGSYCAPPYNNNGLYYSCRGSTCTGTSVPLSNQVQNPVALLPVDNNGVIVQLPSVASGGTTSVNGSLVLGIGTQPNNMPLAGVTMYPANQQAEFTTVFNSTSYVQSFIDSGSNGLFFDASSISALPSCTSGIAQGWFCPSSTQSLSATNKGYTGSPSGTVSFQIGNASSLFNSSNNVFIELGADSPGTSFDWGLPFFLGRTVYVGIDGNTSSLGTGPYWAY